MDDFSVSLNFWARYIFSYPEKGMKNSLHIYSPQIVTRNWSHSYTHNILSFIEPLKNVLHVCPFWDLRKEKKQFPEWRKWLKIRAQWLQRDPIGELEKRVVNFWSEYTERLQSIL